LGNRLQNCTLLGYRAELAKSLPLKSKNASDVVGGEGSTRFKTIIVPQQVTEQLVRSSPLTLFGTIGSGSGARADQPDSFRYQRMACLATSSLGHEGHDLIFVYVPTMAVVIYRCGRCLTRSKSVRSFYKVQRNESTRLH
jgi:hypothetical protein